MITKEAIEAAAAEIQMLHGAGATVSEQAERILTAAFAAMPARLTEDQLCGTPFIEELVPLGNEWAACETIQDRHDLLKRRVRASFALATPATPPPTLAAENERLRVALEKIAAFGDGQPSNIHDLQEQRYSARATRIARAALEGT